MEPWAATKSSKYFVFSSWERVFGADACRSRGEPVRVATAADMVFSEYGWVVDSGFDYAVRWLAAIVRKRGK